MSLWRGNVANIYKIFIQSLTNILIYQKIKFYYLNPAKKSTTNAVSKLKYSEKLTASTISTFISLIFSYPLELAHTRMSGDMTRFGHRNIYSGISELFTKIMEERSKLHILNSVILIYI